MLRAIAAAALALVLAANGAMAQTIRMWTFLNPDGKSGREMVLKKLIAGFESANPRVKVQVETQEYRSMADKFFAATQTGGAPDVIWLHTSRIIDGIKMGALANLDPLMGWTPDDVADVDGPLWRYGASKNAHYQVMHSRNMIGQFYRTDLFRAAGIDPKSLTTWDKFIAAAQKLVQKDAAGNVTRWGFGQPGTGAIPASSTVFAMLMDKNGTIFGPNLRAAWANPAGIQSVQAEADMLGRYGISPPNMMSMIDDDIYEQFNSGRMAIIRAGTARMASSIAALGSGKVGYMPTPSFTEGKHSVAEPQAWCIGVWSGSKQQALAGKFVAYLSSKQADTMWALQAGVMPIRKSTVAEHADFFANPDNAYLAASAADLRDNGWFPPPGAGGGWGEGLNAAVQDVVTYHTDPKAALEKAETAFDRANRR